MLQSRFSEIISIALFLSTVIATAHPQTVVSYPDPARVVFTRENAPLCPSLAALTQLMQRAYAHDINASLFDFGCFPSAANWPGQILKERAGTDLWAEVRVVMPMTGPRSFWTIAWELQNGVETRSRVSIVHGHRSAAKAHRKPYERKSTRRNSSHSPTSKNHGHSSTKRSLSEKENLTD